MTAPAHPLLVVRGLCKHYDVVSRGLVRKRISRIRACHDVSFDLHAGRTLGIVGESGSGKTTVARSILRAVRPTAGQVLFDAGSRLHIDLASATDAQLRPLRTQMQMIFQDPFSSLNPRMNVRQIVAEPLVIHRLARGGELEDRVAAMLQRVGIRPEYRTRYPHAFSGGQRQRIAIARALIMHPKFVVADEAVSALDVSVQAQVVNLLKDLQEEFRLTYIFIAHDLSIVRHICDRVAVMYAGRIVELAPCAQLFEQPRHPYTRMLLAAVPVPDPRVRMSLSVVGDPVDVANLPSGCAFHPRCPECFDPCRAQTPALESTGDRSVACHLHASTM